MLRAFMLLGAPGPGPGGASENHPAPGSALHSETQGGAGRPFPHPVLLHSGESPAARASPTSVRA